MVLIAIVVEQSRRCLETFGFILKVNKAIAIALIGN